MSYTEIQGTVNFCIMQEACLTNELTDIMTSITQATRKICSIADATSSARDAVRASYTVDDPQYQVAMDDIQSEYELQLAQITSWESELETQKSAKETELQATSSYKQSFLSLLKQNVEKDSKYGGS